MSTTTAVLSLVKHADGDNARTALSTDQPANMDAIDALFHATTGHTHTGAGTNGSKILLTNVLPTGLTAGKLLAPNSGLTALEHASKNFIGDDANANMTVGLTINQGANDDESLALKSSDVAHGITDNAETDTYGAVRKIIAASGGVQLAGYSSVSRGLQLRGIAVTDLTTKQADSNGYVELQAEKKTGTTIGAAGADANLVVISNDSTTRFIFDAEGSAHGDVEWIAFDEHDDVALLNALDAAMTKDPVKTAFGQYLDDFRQQLQTARIVNFYDPEGSRAMVNFTRLSMLLTGAVRQMGQRNAELMDRLGAIESRLALLPEGRS